MTCKFCGNNNKMVRAHIIPKAFFIALNSDPSDPSKLITNKQNVYPKKSPIGVWDQNLVCEICESTTFTPLDDYAITFFRDMDEKHDQFLIDGNLAGFYAAPNYAKLKLFFLSLLWRSSVSKHDYYADVNIGSHEDKIKKMLGIRSPGSPQHYPVLIRRFDCDPKLVPMLGPRKDKFKGVWRYHFVFYGYHIVIGAASHRVVSDLDAFLLRDNLKTMIAFEPYSGSTYHQIALKVAAKQKVRVFKTESYTKINK